jgi:putative sterol carrier protein
MPEGDLPGGAKGGPDFRAILSRLPTALDATAAAGVEGVVQFDLTGQGGGAYYLTLRDGTCTVGEGRHPTPSVILTLSAADCLAVLTGGAKARALFETGRLQVAGNVFLALMLRDLFPRDRLLS